MPSESRSGRTRLLHLLAKFAVAYVLATATLHSIGSLYGEALLPVLETSFKLFHPELGVPSFSIGGDKLRMQTEFQVAVPGRALRQNATAHFELPLPTLYVCPVLALTMLLAWPDRSRAARLRSLLLSVPLIGLVEGADSAQTFALLLSDKIEAARNVSGNTLGPFWGFFLENGGRQSLSILVAPLAMLGGESLWARLVARYTNQPTDGRDHVRRRRVATGLTDATDQGGIEFTEYPTCKPRV